LRLRQLSFQGGLLQFARAQAAIVKNGMRCHCDERGNKQINVKSQAEVSPIALDQAEPTMRERGKKPEGSEMDEIVQDRKEKDCGQMQEQFPQLERLYFERKAPAEIEDQDSQNSPEVEEIQVKP